MVNICDKENGNMLLMAFESAKEKYPEHKEVFEGLNEVVKNRIIGFPFGSNEEEVNAYIDKFFERYKVSEKVMDTFLLSKALIKSIVYYLLETSNKEDQTVDSILKLLRYNLPDRHLSIRLVIGDVVIDKPVSETRSEKEEADDTSSVYGLLLDGLRYQNPASPALEPYEFFLSHSREKREEACLLAIYIVMNSKR